MDTPHMPRRKANTIANGVLLIGLGLLFFWDAWWPGILFVLGISLAARQFLTGRTTDLLITLGILAVILIISLISIAPSVLLSFVFIILGVYLIAREYFLQDSDRWK